MAFDPGDTTGYAKVEVEPDKEVWVLRKGTFPWPEGMDDAIRMSLDTDIVIAEDFIVRQPLIGSKIEAIKVIGVLEFVVGHKLVLQQPAEKQRCPDKLLKELGLWDKSEHVRDALKHVVIYLQKNKG